MSRGKRDNVRFIGDKKGANQSSDDEEGSICSSASSEEQQQAHQMLAGGGMVLPSFQASGGSPIGQSPVKSPIIASKLVLMCTHPSPHAPCVHSLSVPAVGATGDKGVCVGLCVTGSRARARVSVCMVSIGAPAPPPPLPRVWERVWECV
jgi:hypothetical protein